MKTERGFTLVELLVVIVIIAILATVGLTLFSSSQTSARDAKRKEDINAIASALEVHFGDPTWGGKADVYNCVRDEYFANRDQAYKDPKTGQHYSIPGCGPANCTTLAGDVVTYCSVLAANSTPGNSYYTSWWVCATLETPNSGNQNEANCTAGTCHYCIPNRR